METLLAKGLSGLDALFSKGWFAAMGIIGLILLLGLLLFGTPFDPGLVGSIAVAMIGIGFGEAECRGKRERIVPTLYGTYKVTSPRWRLTAMGAVLHLFGWSGLAYALLTLWQA